ncbi:hypothetical protein B0H14DRAFT_2618041 [Mycena olivaceomarginata]|nr:hypothetical protein B0H14DRAFT_2618041 [Mycena olivaceomarginata]
MPGFDATDLRRACGSGCGEVSADRSDREQRPVLGSSSLKNERTGNIMEIEPHGELAQNEECPAGDIFRIATGWLALGIPDCEIGAKTSGRASMIILGEVNAYSYGTVLEIARGGVIVAYHSWGG